MAMQALNYPTVDLRVAGPAANPSSGFVSTVEQGLSRRLGTVAILYSLAWVTHFTFLELTSSSATKPADTPFWYFVCAFCVLLGLVVFAACRSGRIPARAFNTLALTFQVLGALGIMLPAIGWENQGAQFVAEIGRTLGIGADQVLPAIVAPLDRAGLRLLYFNGVPGVAVWLVVFSLIVPASRKRTVMAALLTAATVPAVLLLSLAIGPAPANIGPWVYPYIAEATVPTIICSLIAIFGSRVVYNLTRDLSTARRLGSYQLIEKIGAGGMGEVWKAQHQLLARPAAIKLIRAEKLGTDDAAVQRFEREAQATSGLTSAHSIDLYDFGVTGDGTFYYVMELLQGVDLRTFVDRHGPMPAERAVYLLRQVCHSLADAHETGVVHRDIKPANLFLCRQGGECDFLKVLDFGLVKQVDRRANHAQLTQEGLTSGTPGFMAPEMISDPDRVDARADIYAVGCVAYWLLTGREVFEGPSAMSVLLQHAKDEPPAPSSRTEIEIPPDLENLVLRCLRKDPDARPLGARDLSRELAACAAALPAWTEERAQQWWRLHLPHLLPSA